MMLETKLMQDFGSLIALAYASDPALIAKWHVTAGSGLKACIDRTVNDLGACDTLQFYVVTKDDMFAGYFGLEFDGKYMPTLFIMPKYRPLKEEFWKEIEMKAHEKFRAGIYSKNEPCLMFYTKKGMEVGRFETPDGEAVVFEFKKDTQCH